MSLSPSAQRVRDAAQAAYWRDDAMCPADAEVIAVSALRAAVEEVLPEGNNGAGYDFKVEYVRNEFLAIAAELEALP